MSTYGRLPVSFTHGAGAWLWDEQGKKYLDALSGIAVCGLGHAHPAVRDALCEQAGQLIHTSNLYGIGHQEALADELVRLSGMERVFFANSGAEANEAAIKIARLYGHRRGVEAPAILVMENSFHGRTLATLSATGNTKVQQGFEPLVSGFVRAPYGDIKALKQLAADNPNLVAVLVEPIQGEGGINIPPAGYLAAIRDLCDRQGWLMMLDEIQTAIGRSGRMFAFQHADLLPDVMTLAKALGNGVPIGACLARGEAARTLGPGNHGSTFGGNPLACRVASAVLGVVESGQLPERAAALGERLRAGFRAALEGAPGIREIRGLGLLIGIELERPCASLVGRALEAGLLINVTAERVIRLLPPLILSDEDADLLVERLSGLIRTYVTEPIQ